MVDELVSVGVCVLLPVLLGAGVRHSVKDKLSQRSGPCLGHGPISSWGSVLRLLNASFLIRKSRIKGSRKPRFLDYKMLLLLS